MKKCLPTLLTTLIWQLLYSQSAYASLAEQCLIGIPQFDKPVVEGDTNDQPVHITSEKSDVNYPRNALFSGDVTIEQGNRTLTAQQAEVEQTDSADPNTPVRTVTASGDVRYQDNQVKLSGPKAWSNLNTKDTDVYQGEYQMVGRQGRGDADLMKMRDNNRYTVLENGSFTSCLPGDNSWSIVGSEVIHDRDEEVAEIWNARFKLGPVPVFYSPYLQLPTGNKRRSGFLIPNASYSSRDGFEFLLPYYWNIAPNYDATITPHLISRRGLQWQNEFRYLTRPGAGTMALEWLPNDKLFKDKDEDNKRWLFYWAHNGVMNNVWRFNADFTKVSDPYYLGDFSSPYGSSTDGYATQKFSLGYAEQNWNAQLSSKKFQVFTIGGDANAYRAEPQLDLNFYQNDLGPFDLHIYGQATKFISESRDNPKTTRLHLEPALSLPLSNGWASLNNEVKLLATRYQQDLRSGSPLTLDRSISRVLPQVKVDGKMVFERDMQWFKAHTQTLEPRLQYLYVPYKDQSDIYIYDTTLLQADYNGLFRERSFSGLDRIASASQLSTGVTSRVYDEKLNERFNLSVGQIYYFNSPRTGNQQDLPNTLSDSNKETGSLAWATDTYWRINNQWGIRGGLQYDRRVSNLTLANGVIEYRQDQDRVLQLNYRYASGDYITAMLPKLTAPWYREGLSQAGLFASWPIADRWALVGSYHYDTKRKQTANRLVGLQYNTCCWAVRLGYERKIDEWDELRKTSLYENKYSINFELRGLGGSQNLGSGVMLRSGVLPYQRAF